MLLRLKCIYILPHIMALCLLMLLFACCTFSVEDDSSILVFGAASLSDVLIEVAEDYTDTNSGVSVRFSFAGSNLLANQIVAGAPADMVFTAGYTPIQRLIDSGIVDESSVSQIVTNHLVVVKHVTSESEEISSLDGLLDAGTIAVPDHETAPAGEYARLALLDADVWGQLQGQVIPTVDVRAALGAVASRNVDWAIVYRTDALSLVGDVEIALDIEAESSDSVPSYYVAPIGEGDALIDFIEYLHSSESAAIFRQYGFQP